MLQIARLVFLDEKLRIVSALKKLGTRARSGVDYLVHEKYGRPVRSRWQNHALTNALSEASIRAGRLPIFTCLA
jgi:hypothetical protein